MIKSKNSQEKLTDEEYSAWLKYMTTQCYGCATQRYACEHDSIDESDEYPEWWEEV